MKKLNTLNKRWNAKNSKLIFSLRTWPNSGSLQMKEKQNIEGKLIIILILIGKIIIGLKIVIGVLFAF